MSATREAEPASPAISPEAILRAVLAMTADQRRELRALLEEPERKTPITLPRRR